MAAPTAYYVDFGTGNDYKGASFTDGAFTVADMTLTKAGAFAASKANHYLYLQDNGSGNVTAGYYKIASVTSANAVVLATSPKSGATDPTDVKCTQAAGTALLPFRSVQGALDLITRDATNGDQINVKASTAQVLAASLAVTTYGAPTVSAPLVVRGYTTTAGDGGIAEIDSNGVTMWAAANNGIYLVDLQIHNFGNNNGIVLSAGCLVFRCNLHRGASTPSGKTILTTAAGSLVIGNYVHDLAAAATDGNGIAGTNTIVYGNYVAVNNAGAGIVIGHIINNVIVCSVTGARGIKQTAASHHVIGNTVYNSTAGTVPGIDTSSNARDGCAFFNNVVEGFSGVGGVGLNDLATTMLAGYNATYNNTTATAYAIGPCIDLTANDQALAASPFTNPGAGDFSVTTALKALAWPIGDFNANLGSTHQFLDIGAVQRQESSGISMPRVRVGH